MASGGDKCRRAVKMFCSLFDLGAFAHFAFESVCVRVCVCVSVNVM